MERDNEYYIKGVLEKQRLVLKEIEKNCLFKVRHFVLQNSGTQSDAWDMYQKGFVTVYLKLKEGDLNLSSSFTNFLIGVSCNHWRNELKKKYRKELTIPEYNTYTSDDDIERTLIEHEQRRLYEEKIKELGEACQKLLALFFQGLKYAQIATELGYASDGTARTQKHKCQQQLIKKIQADLRFKELRNG